MWDHSDWLGKLDKGILNKQTIFAYLSEQRTSFSVVLGKVRVIPSVPV